MKNDFYKINTVKFVDYMCKKVKNQQKTQIEFIGCTLSMFLPKDLNDLFLKKASTLIYW